MRYLLIRPDRIGDILLTTPAIATLRRSFPQAHISVLVRPYTAPLLRQNPDLDELLLDEGEPVGELAAKLREKRFDTAVHFLCT